MPRADLGDIAGAPVWRLVQRFEPEVADRRAAAAGVEHGSPGESPGLIGSRLPIAERVVAAQLAELLLPVAQGAGVQPVRVQAIEQRLGAAAAQRLVQAPAEGAIVRVLAVAQRQHGVLQPAQVGI